MRGVHRNWTHPWQQALQGLAISSDVTHDPGGEATPRHSRKACHHRRGGDSRVTTRRKGSTHPDGHLRSDLHPTNSVSPERQRQSTKGSLRILSPRLPWLPTVLLRSEQSPEQTARRGSACPSTDLADLRYSSDRNIRQEIRIQTATAASHSAAVWSSLLSEAELYIVVEFGEYANQPPSAGPFILATAAEATMANQAPSQLMPQFSVPDSCAHHDAGPRSERQSGARPLVVAVTTRSRQRWSLRSEEGSLRPNPASSATSIAVDGSVRERPLVPARRQSVRAHLHRPSVTSVSSNTVPAFSTPP